MRDKPEVTKLILDTIEDSKFLGLLYPDDSAGTRVSRISFLADLYLNMPDKGVSSYFVLIVVS